MLYEFAWILVGCFSQFPAVRIFCKDAVFALFFNYFYQVTFFAALMVFSGSAEEKGRNSFIPCLKAIAEGEKEEKASGKISGTQNKVVPEEISKSFKETINEKSSDQIVMTETKSDINSMKDTEQPAEKKLTERKKKKKSIFRIYYGELLLSRIGRIVALSLFVGYLICSVFFCLDIKMGMEFENLLLRSHPGIQFLHNEEKFFRTGYQADVVVEKSPDLKKRRNRMKMMEVVEAFEKSKGTAEGRNGTQFWMLAYLQFLKSSHSFEQDTEEQWDRGVWYFTQRANAFRRMWSQDVVLSNVSGRVRVTSFRFRISLSEFTTNSQIFETVQEFRRIARSYKRFGVITYSQNWFNGDRLDVILPNTLQNIALALGCMVVVSVLLIPEPICTLWITLAICSIDIGVIGFMTLWGVNLDSVSMISIIMSIGFSVDFTAHITYGYVTSEESHPRLKSLDALDRVGWPVFQGSISTLLGVAVLGFVDSYLVTVFFKTVFLVMLFGTIHALLFLPVILSLGMPAMEKLLSRVRCPRKSTNPNEPS